MINFIKILNQILYAIFIMKSNYRYTIPSLVNDNDFSNLSPTSLFSTSEKVS